MRWPGSSRSRRASRSSSPRRAIPASRTTRELVPLDLADHAAVVAFCRARGSTWSWSGRRRRSSPASSTTSPPTGIAVFGPSRAAAQLEGSKGFTKDLCAEAGIPTARLRPLPRCRGRRGLRARPRARRSWSRPTGSPPARASPSRRPSTRRWPRSMDCFVGRLRRGGRRGRDRGLPRTARRRASSPSPTARPSSPLAHRAGPQARLRRRPRAQHRRHGRLLAGAGDDAGAGRAQTMDEIVAPTVAAMARRGTPFAACLYAGLMLTDATGRSSSNTTSASATRRRRC